MSREIIQVDGAGRIVLPKPIRKRFNLLAGDKLKLSVDESGIRLEPQVAPGKLVRKGSVLVFTGEFSERITDQFIEQMIKEDREGNSESHLKMALHPK